MCARMHVLKGFLFLAQSLSGGHPDWVLNLAIIVAKIIPTEQRRFLFSL